jgi:hypothetical protein
MAVLGLPASQRRQARRNCHDRLGDRPILPATQAERDMASRTCSQAKFWAPNTKNPNEYEAALKYARVLPRYRLVRPRHRSGAQGSPSSRATWSSR